MTPGATMLDLLEKHGGWGLSVILMVVIAALWRAAGSERREAKVAVDDAHKREVAALKLVLPVTEKLLTAVSVLEAKNRRRAGDGVSGSTPGTPDPLLVKP